MNGRIIGWALLLAAGIVTFVFLRQGGETVTLTAQHHPTTGTAVYLLLDVSGSMGDPLAGTTHAKLDDAKKSAIAVCKQIAKYADEDKSRNIQLAIACFNENVTPLVPMGKPNVAVAENAINRMTPNGSTAIGRAVAHAQKELDKTGLFRQHILLVTDGDNTDGIRPDAVAGALNKLPEDLRPATYVVAFDVNAKVFDSVKTQGWQIFSAANGKELEQQLDQVVGGKILLEKLDSAIPTTR